MAQKVVSYSKVPVMVVKE
ncbi:MAG: hypothetical protein WHF31_06305 [Candidatus Dehalobacter alkaniphilus]|nr:hypothetical protein LPY66_01665 [Dehalobacter sp. DCM]